MPGALFIIKTNIFNGDIEINLETAIDIRQSIYIIFNKDLTDGQKFDLCKLTRNREFYSNTHPLIYSDKWTVNSDSEKFIFYCPHNNIQFPEDLIEMLDIKNTQIIKKIKYYYDN